LIVDGAALVQMLSPAHMCHTFEDYGKQQFIPYLENLLRNFMENVASAALLACHVPHYVFAMEIVCQIRSEFHVNIFDPSVGEV
jgi:hypothetical protein